MQKNYSGLMIKPKKSLGQNFLIDENIARKIILSLSLKKNDKVLEIGAGQGVLTKYIIEKVDTFRAIEIDRNLVPLLRTKFEDYKTFQLIEGNFLEIDMEGIFSNHKKWKVVGNIPYHITSSIIFKIFEYREYIQSLTLMIQKEVAQRITAKPGTKIYGIPSVYSQLYADVEILFNVSKNVFYPKPKVDSAVIRWNFLSQNRYQLDDEELFKTIVKSIFGQRRKVIKNSLKKLGINNELVNFPLDKRPEQLTVKELVLLSNLVAYGRNGYQRNC